MDHLAHDLTVALEESESCGPISFESGRKWGMRRRTRSAGNLRKFTNSKPLLDKIFRTTHFTDFKH